MGFSGSRFGFKKRGECAAGKGGEDWANAGGNLSGWFYLGRGQGREERKMVDSRGKYRERWRGGGGGLQEKGEREGGAAPFEKSWF